MAPTSKKKPTPAKKAAPTRLRGASQDDPNTYRITRRQWAEIEPVLMAVGRYFSGESKLTPAKKRGRVAGNGKAAQL